MKKNICRKCTKYKVDADDPPCNLCLGTVNFYGFDKVKEEKEVKDGELWNETM